MISHKEARKIASTLVSQMSIEECVEQLNFRSPAIKRLGISPYNYWNEGLHGVARAGIATVFPQAIGLAASFDSQLMYEVANAISTEGRAKFNVYASEKDFDIYKGLTYWAPNLNIFRDPRWGRGQETYGEDPYLVSTLGVAYIRGLQGEGEYLKLAACAKHFAVHSGPEAVRHSFDATVSMKDLYETYLPAFERAVVEADVEGVMGAYNAVNGTPACVNPLLLQDILRNQWNFEGYVVSDYAALEDVFENHHFSESHMDTMKQALEVGCHLCAGNISHYVYEGLENGSITHELVREAVVALYTTRVRLGMFDATHQWNQLDYDVVESSTHIKLALEAAEQSMVLLKNDGFLPLELHKGTKVAVIGPNASNIRALEGNYCGTATSYSTFLEGIRQAVSPEGKVYFAKGCHHFKDHAESTLSHAHERESEAIAVCKRSDYIVVCVGLDPSMEGEQGDAGNVYGSGDREDLGLPAVQERLLRKIVELNKPVIVVTSSGSPLHLNGLEQHEAIRAIIHTWYPGCRGGEALANILYGKTSPTAKLPITFYAPENVLPAFEDYSMKNRTYRYMEGVPLYPFGYGLTYGQLHIKKGECIVSDYECRIQVVVENLEEYHVTETLQLYVRVNSQWEVLNRRLIDYTKIHVEGKSEATYCFVVPKEKLSVVDENGNRCLDGTCAEFMIGFHSQADVRHFVLDVNFKK